MARLSSLKKKWKNVSRETDDLSDDSIGNLLDSIMRFILSFFPTIESIRTISILHLDNCTGDCDKSCEGLKNKVFLFHNAPSRYKLYLSVSANFDDFCFGAWFNGWPTLQSLSLLSSIERYISTLLVSSPSLKRLDVSLVNDYDRCELEKFEIIAISLKYIRISNCFVLCAFRTIEFLSKLFEAAFL
ncbi:hypothetical protein M9H77_23959 [Catharanthus roseus]|uniref:Uncharacterized protein n=1 Tax=Catharanthus roseus TaxID=4058 RepID=A0ACC0AYW9_CATRO|nr:hypothetical protein M9H77_23959 [Catharanthus roseus]